MAPAGVVAVVGGEQRALGGRVVGEGVVEQVVEVGPGRHGAERPVPRGDDGPDLAVDHLDRLDQHGDDLAGRTGAVDAVDVAGDGELVAEGALVEAVGDDIDVLAHALNGTKGV